MHYRTELKNKRFPGQSQVNAAKPKAVTEYLSDLAMIAMTALILQWSRPASDRHDCRSADVSSSPSAQRETPETAAEAQVPDPSSNSTSRWAPCRIASPPAKTTS